MQSLHLGDVDSNGETGNNDPLANLARSGAPDKAIHPEFPNPDNTSMAETH
jgi:hypothetical protein